MKLYDCRTNNHDTYIPRAHTSWGIVSTQGVVSRVHMDTTGLATVSQPLVGEKFWAVANPRPEFEGIEDGDIDKYLKFSDDYIDERYRWEAVSLTNRNALYAPQIYSHFTIITTTNSFMRPNTLHYVLTQDPATVYGSHFYATANILATCSGVVHSLLVDHLATNTSHPDLIPNLAMLNYYHNEAWFHRIDSPCKRYCPCLLYLYSPIIYRSRHCSENM